MRGVQVREYGEAQALRVGEIERPAPRPGEVLIEIEYAGVNFIDVYMRRGVYRHSETYKNTPPFTPGMEGAGTVVALGEGVDDAAVGQRVAYCLSLGSYAEYAVVPAWRLVPVPDAVDLQTATTLMLQGCTAHYLSHSLFALGAGQSCLVHAAAGGVGQILTQLAKIRGARVIATVGSEDKAQIARDNGADDVVLYKKVDFAEAVAELTQGEGVNVVYDGIGQATYKQSLKSLRRRGTLALFGGASGQVESITPLDLAEAGSVFVTRPHMADYMQDAAEIRQRAGDLFEHVVANRLHVRIDRLFDLPESAEAHRAIETGTTRGKLLIRC